MFKDYDKYLSASLKVYLFVLVIIFILKIVGLDYFGLNINDSVFTRIFMFLAKYKIDYIIQNMFLFLNFYLIKSIILKKYKFDFEAILIPLIIMIGTYFLYKFDLKQFYSLYNTLVMFIYFLIKKVKIKRIIKVFLINILIQFISSIIRNYDIQNYKTLINLIMNIDYYIMLIIWYKIEKQGGEDEMDRMAGEYGRYMESRERYGAGEDTKKSLEYMLRSMEDFARMLKEDAKSQEEVEMIRQTAQRIAQM